MPTESSGMAREITDADGITWSCIQAFAGLGNNAEKVDAARVSGREELVYVVCTPSGGAQSVRVELPDSWEKGLPDDALLRKIHARLSEEQAQS